jgi:hypothetical protein
MHKFTKEGSVCTSDRRARFALVVMVVMVAWAASGCATVRPSARAALADPIMQFEGDAKQAAAMRHALENREGAMGGSGVGGGGCGCN